VPVPVGDGHPPLRPAVRPPWGRPYRKRIGHWRNQPASPRTRRPSCSAGPWTWSGASSPARALRREADSVAPAATFRALATSVRSSSCRGRIRAGPGDPDRDLERRHLPRPPRIASGRSRPEERGTSCREAIRRPHADIEKVEIVSRRRRVRRRNCSIPSKAAYGEYEVVPRTRFGHASPPMPRRCGMAGSGRAVEPWKLADLNRRGRRPRRRRHRAGRVRFVMKDARRSGQ